MSVNLSPGMVTISDKGTVSKMDIEAILVLIVVFGPVGLYVIYMLRRHKTEGGMYERYIEFGKQTGRLLNTNHTAKTQQVPRVRWKHRKIVGLMVGHFGVERVAEFYEKYNINKQRNGEMEYLSNSFYLILR
jgi:hypothetical protein